MTTYARTVNNYVDSRRSGLDTDRRTYPACQAPYISPEWFDMLQQYYGEIDKLRQDWALEVLGRKMIVGFYFDHLRSEDAYFTDWPTRDRGSIKTLPKRLQTHFRAKKMRLWYYWEFHVKRGILPLRWGPLQDHYMGLRRKIELKYAFLGRLGFADLGKNR
ncbi:hypothetical protein DHEL01_v211556 [Diaporthe helianthi]|uniref:Uncharacterized protein n=1 Tax=Diaporthe helianthi TaxID=158607 RepID=A0A2P5HIG7_DIAHE|nr:hypothetical protein DHEL01_v211556 [Diaporthe helianthi]